MNDPQSGVAGVQGGSQQDNMLAAQTAGMNDPQSTQATAQQAAVASGQPDDVTGVDAAVAAQAAAPAQQAASPAKPAAKPAAKGDPKVMAMQQELIKKGAKIKADGIMGPQTIAAQKQFGAPGTDLSGRMTGATDPRVAAARPGANQPAAYNAAKDSQAANVAMAAKPAAGQAASPAAPQPGVGQKGPTKAAAAGQDPSNPLNKAPAAGQPVPPKPGKAVAANGQISDTPAAESIREADNILLNKMLSIAKLR
jgi:hypothetical protein